MSNIAFVNGETPLNADNMNKLQNEGTMTEKGQVKLSTDGGASAVGTSGQRIGALRYEANMSNITPNANDYRTPGEWYFYYLPITTIPDSAKPNTVTNNWPKFGTTYAVGTSGTGVTLKVMQQYSNTYCTQMCWQRGKNEIWIRSSSAASTWSDWEKVSAKLYSGTGTAIDGAMTQKATTDALASHTHTTSQITGLGQVATTNNYNDLSNKPTSFTPSSHTHSTSQITGLATVATTNNYEDLINKPTISTLRPVILVVGFSDGCDYKITSTTATNMQTTINSAIAALPANGGKIVLREGNYNINANITVNKPNVTLEGMGNSTIIKRMANFTNGMIYITQDYCKIQNLYIDGNKTSYTSIDNHAIYSSFSNHTISEITMKNSYNGIYLTGSNNRIIANNYSNGPSGICFSGSNNTIAGNICNISGNGYGINFTSTGGYNTITDNTCNNGSYGIQIENSGTPIENFGCYNIITNNTCNNNYQGLRLHVKTSTISDNTCNLNNDGIIIVGDGNTITGNTCGSNSFCGIACCFSKNNSIIGNTCINCGPDGGIYLDSISDSNITGNNCCGSDYGIYFDGLYSSGISNNNTITGNVCNGNNIDGICIDSPATFNYGSITGNTCISNMRYGINLESGNYNIIGLNQVYSNGTATYQGGTGNTWISNKNASTII